MSNGVALYYPHIEFRDPTWLKWALLFWDRGVRRIVPEDVTPADSPEIAEAVRSRAIKNVDSGPYLDLAATEFEAHLDAYLAVADREAPEQTASSNSPVVNTHLEIDSAMRLSKMRMDVVERLRRLDLAYTRTDGLNGHTLSAPRPLVALYMTILARKMSESTGAPVITDRPTYARMANQIIGGSVIQDVPEASNVIQHIFVDFVRPQSVERLSMLEVLRIREKLLPSMKRFRVKIEASVTKLSGATDATAYEDAMQSARDEITEAVVLHGDKCRTAGLEFGQKALGISGLSLLPAVAGIAGHVLAPVTLGVSVAAAFALSTLIYRQQRTAAANSFAYQYVLSLERMLK